MSKLISQNPPSEWRIKKIGEVCRIRKREKVPSLKEIAHIPMENILNDGIFAEYIVKETSKIKSGDVCKEGDILLAKITPSFENGKQGFVPQIPTDYAITTTEALPIVCSEQVAPFYIFYCLKNPLTRTIIASKMEGSTGRQRVPSDIVLNYRIPVPPLVEQCGIVEVLSTVDECIRYTDLVIEKTEELKRGLMQQLLRNGVKHKHLKKTVIGEIPEDWHIFRLKNICSEMTIGVVNPATPYYTTQKEGVPYFRTQNVRENKLTNTNIFVREEFNNKHKKSILRENDILTIQTGFIGTSCLVPKKFEGANCHSLLITRTDKNILNAIFFCHLMNSTTGKRIMSKFAQIGERGHLLLGDFRNMKVPIPSLEEQEKIALILSRTYEKIDVLKTYKNRLQTLKKGLMQLLLSGKVRVELGEDGLHRIWNS